MKVSARTWGGCSGSRLSLALTALLLLRSALGAQGLVLGYSGQTVAGRWNPLFIDESIASRADAVRLSFSGNEGKPLGSETFALGSPGKAVLPLMVGLDLKGISVSILSRGREISRLALDPSLRPANGHLVLCVGQSPSSLRAIASVLAPKELVQVVELTASELPAPPLAWDCVSALVLEEEGTILNPAQEEALRAWHACAGRLVITRATEGPEALLADMGGIIRLPAGSAPRGEADAAAYWAEALDLRPYQEDRRLSPALSFDAAAEPRGRGIGLFPLGATLILAALVIALAILLRSPALAARRPLLFAAWLLGASLAAWILGASLSSRDAKGASTAFKAILLPGEGGLLADFRISLQPPEGRGPSLLDASPLGVELDFDTSEGGRFGNLDEAAWVHRSLRPWFSLSRGGPSFSRLSALLPAVAASGSEALLLPDALSFQRGRPLPPGLAVRGKLALRDGTGIWWTWMPESGAWGRSSGMPAFLAPDRLWIESIAPLLGGGPILLGDSPFPALRFRLEGRSPTGRKGSSLLWARSLPMEEETE